MDKTILIVDDEEFFRERLCRAFHDRGFTVFSAPGYDEALAVIQDEYPDFGVIDLKMPGKSGLELIEAIQKVYPEMRLVVLTGYGSIATALEAVKLGAVNYLSKPADVDEILKALGRVADETPDPDDVDIKAPSLARVEWEHINRVLNDCNGNISVAAKRLGIHRRTLQRKLYKYAPKEQYID